MIETSYDARDINANDIPEMFRIGKKHPTNFRLKDPIEKTKEIYDENCI